jgi:hypothetical protein
VLKTSCESKVKVFDCMYCYHVSNSSPMMLRMPSRTCFTTGNAAPDVQ